MRRMLWLGFGAAALLLAYLLTANFWATTLVYARQESQNDLPSAPAQSGGAMLFPEVVAFNLEGERFALPGDFAGRPSLVAIAYWQDQQFDVNTWFPLADDLRQTYPGLVFYELPTVSDRSAAERAWLDGIMRAGIRDEAIRRVTITLYLNVARFNALLDIPDTRAIQLLLIDESGAVIWRESGRLTEAKADSLRAALAEYTPQD